MRGLITIALLLIAGHAGAEQLTLDIRTFHDESRRVTCWVYEGFKKGGISCLPDSSLPQSPTATTTTESEAIRASLASLEGETGQVTTTSLPQVILRNTSESSTCAKPQVSAPAARLKDERFQL